MRFDPALAALNQYKGIRKIQLRGRNAAVSTSAETVWGPGATYARLSAGTALEVVSGSANDTSAGTGARTIVVEGLDGDYNEFTETVTLNGVSAVALTNTSAVAINNAYVATAGSGLTNAGAIDIRTVAGSTIKRQISTGATLGLGQAADFLFTIPAGHIGLLKTIEFSATGVTGDLTVYLNSHSASGIIKNEGAGKSSLYVTAFNGARGKINFGGGLRIEEKTLIELRAIASAGAGDLVATADLFIFDKDGNSFGVI